jgi:hypothetical protein
VVKIAPQRPKLTSKMAKLLSPSIYVNASFRRTLFESGTCIILPAPLGQLFCGLLLVGGSNSEGWRAGTMTACDEKIKRRTTKQQPTNERQRSGGGSGGGSATA